VGPVIRIGANTAIFSVVDAVHCVRQLQVDAAGARGTRPSCF
jgi:hypothetical protein